MGRCRRMTELTGVEVVFLTNQDQRAHERAQHEPTHARRGHRSGKHRPEPASGRHPRQTREATTAKGRKRTHSRNLEPQVRTTSSLANNNRMTKRTPFPTCCPSGGESCGISIGIFSLLGAMTPKTNASAAATADTSSAWTWSSNKFPRIIGCLVSREWRRPVLAAVPRRAERFISRFPLRLLMMGIRTKSSSVVRSAFQRLDSGAEEQKKTILLGVDYGIGNGTHALTDTRSRSSPVNTIPKTVIHKVGAALRGVE